MMFIKALEKKGREGGFLGVLHLILRRPPPPARVAVALSGNEAKMLSFGKGKLLPVSFLGTLELPPEVYEAGTVKDREGLVVLLEHLLKTLGRKRVGAVVILPEEKVFTKIIQVKTGEIHSLDSLAGKMLPLPEDAMVVTAREVIPLSRQITHKDYNLWAVEKVYLEAHRYTFLSSGIVPVEFLPESLAIVEALFPQRESWDAPLILVPKKKKVTLLIFAGRAVHFSETLFGELSQDKALHDELVNSVSEAITFYRDKVLHEHGASSVVNRILVIGRLGEALEARLAFTTQMKIEHPDIFGQFQFANDEAKKIVQERPGEWIPLLGGALWINRGAR